MWPSQGIERVWLAESLATIEPWTKQATEQISRTDTHARPVVKDDPRKTAYTGQTRTRCRHQGVVVGNRGLASGHVHYFKTCMFHAVSVVSGHHRVAKRLRRARVELLFVGRHS